MGMFDQDETITDEFFTSDAEQVEDESAESNDEEELVDNEELESDEEVEYEDEDESSEQEQDESPLIAGKFKSQDDLVNAYKNLEKQFTQSRQTKQFETQQPVQQTQQSQEDFNERFFDDFQQNPLGVISYFVNNAVAQVTQPIKDKEQDIALGNDIDKLSKNYKQIQSEEGMTSLFNKAREIAFEMGNENLAKSSRVLSMAAQEVFGDSKADVYKKAKQEGKQEAEETRRTKQEMSTITSSKKPVERAKTAEELAIESIMGASKRNGIFG